MGGFIVLGSRGDVTLWHAKNLPSISDNRLIEWSSGVPVSARTSRGQASIIMGMQFEVSPEFS